MTSRTSTDIVAFGWLAGVTGLNSSMVGMTLPPDAGSWIGTGFVTILNVGGSPARHIPMRNPMVTVNCWAINPTSMDQPWARAHALAELIDAGCRAGNAQRLVTVTGYNAARVFSAYLLSEPRRIHQDRAAHARVMVDLALHWVDLG